MHLSGVNKEPVENELLKLDEKWGEQYPVVVRSWQENWDKLSEYFQYTPAIRKPIGGAYAYYPYFVWRVTGVALY